MIVVYHPYCAAKLGHTASQISDVCLGGHRSRAGSRMTFQEFSQFIELDEFGAVGCANEPAVARQLIDEPLGMQLHHGFAHGSTRDTKFARDRDFRKAARRGQISAQEFSANKRGGAILKFLRIRELTDVHAVCIHDVYSLQIELRFVKKLSTNGYMLADLPLADTLIWRNSVRRACDWLSAQVAEEIPFNMPQADLNWFAKLPWPLAACGYRVAALRAMNRVASGQDSLDRTERVDWTNATPYALGWLVVGARLCERYDLARRFYSELGRYRCPETGGIHSLPLKQAGSTACFDAGIQGAMLHAALAMNDLSAARAAGNLMTRWFMDQPSPKEGLLMLFHPRSGYVQEMTEETKLQRQFKPHDSRQPFANLGFTIQGLIRLAEATGDDQYFVSACGILDHLLEVYHVDLLSHSQNHKVGHAAIMAYRHTHEPRYLDAGVTIAHLVSANIQPDGRALADIFFEDIRQQPLYTTVRTTCDSAIWLHEICNELETLT